MPVIESWKSSCLVTRMFSCLGSSASGGVGVRCPFFLCFFAIGSQYSIYLTQGCTYGATLNSLGKISDPTEISALRTLLKMNDPTGFTALATVLVFQELAAQYKLPYVKMQQHMNHNNNTTSMTSSRNMYTYKKQEIPEFSRLTT